MASDRSVHGVYIAIVLRSVTLILVLRLCWTNAGAQDPVPLAVPDLSGCVAQVLLQDDLGALWIGTDRGLLRFDGAGTERYVSEPTRAHSLPHDNILDLLLDHQGTLWVATSGGLWTVHTRTGAQRHARFRVGSEVRDVEPLHLAPSAGGHWAFCGSAGVYRWSDDDSLYHRVITTGAPPLTHAGGGWEAPDGTLWYVDRMAVRHWMPKEQREEVFPFTPFGKEAPPKTLMLDLQPDRYDAQKVWIGTWGIGLVSFDLVTHALTPYVVQQPLSDLANVVRSAVQVGANSWLVVIDDALYTLNTSADDGGPRAMMPGTLMRSVLRSAKGDLFFGGFERVWAARPRSTGATPMGHTLAMNNTHAIGARDGEGYWAVHFYADRRLMRLDTEGRELFSIPLPLDTLPYEAFRLVQVQNGDLWLGTTRGLMRCPAGTRVIAPVAWQDERYHGRRQAITDLIVDARDRIWALFGHEAVVCIDGSTREQRWVPIGERADLSGLAPLDADRLLVTARGRHPLVIDAASMQAAPFIHPEVSPSVFANVEGAVVQADGKPIFYSYNHGLTRFHDPDGDGRWTLERTWRPATRPGFSAALLDRRGRIWFTTDRGAMVLEPTTGSLMALDPLHGVNSVLHERLTLLPGGDVLACGLPHYRFGSGFDLEQVDAPLVWRSVLAGGIDRTAAAIMDSMITLLPGGANVTFRFGRVAVLEGDAFNYAYRLVRGDGNEGPWVDLGRQRSVSIGELEAGDHRIELRSEGSPATLAHIALRVHVEPFWWATWWFRLLLLAIAVGLGVLATRQVMALRYRRTLREVERQRELERVRMRIARDVHDGIGSRLTKITMMLRNVPGADPEHARRITKASTELVHELGEIVWTVDPRNDDVASFVAFVRSTLGRQAEGLPVELVSKLSFDPAMAKHTLPPDVKRNVLLVMREAVNNALKHSGGDRIDVALDISAHQLRLTVRDNGAGFDIERPREGGNGLHNFRKRAEEVNGVIELNSTAAGTSIMLTVPLPSTNMEGGR